MIFPLSTGSSPALSASLDALCHGRFPKPTCFVFEFPLHSLPSDLVLTFLLLFVCRAISFFFFFIISKRLQDSRYQGLSSKAVGPQTGKRKSFQGKNGPVKKKNVYSLFPPPQPGMQCALRVAILVMKCSSGRKQDLLPARRSPAAVAGHRESGLSAEGP